MKITLRIVFISWIFLVPAIPSSFAGEGGKSSAPFSKGQAVFERSCQWCHGLQGNGKGPAAFFLGAYSAPRPRDFTVGNYKLRSTPSDEFPTDQDLFRTITRGIPGAMPPFASLSIEDRYAVIDFIKSLSSMAFEEAQVIEIKEPSFPASPTSIAKGQRLFFDFQCHTCHGESGRGDGNIALEGQLKDSTDLPILPTDLTNRHAFKNGATRRDIVRSLLTGIVGTPMPSFDGQFENGQADAWHLADFILALSPSPLYGDPS